jgi:hypothetical protein
MGIGDNIRGAAESALKDIAGLSERTDDGHAPEPGNPDDPIKVHSSISEGSNAEEAAEGSLDSGEGPKSVPGSGTDSGAVPDNENQATPSGGETETREYVQDPPHDVPGPGGLPAPDPGGVRADPGETDGDPTTSMGRG